MAIQLISNALKPIEVMVKIYILDLVKKVKTIFSDLKYIHINDPVKKCELFKANGCSHVDGFLCDFPNCIINKKFKNDKHK